MSNYPRIFGQTFPFLLVDDVDAHQFLTCFEEQEIEIVVGTGGRHLTRFDFPNRCRESVEILVRRHIGKTRGPHSSETIPEWINPRG